jgi:hypothetical protein
MTVLGSMARSFMSSVSAGWQRSLVTSGCSFARAAFPPCPPRHAVVT